MGPWKRVLQFSCFKIRFGFLNPAGCEMEGAGRGIERFFGNVGAWAGVMEVFPSSVHPSWSWAGGGWGVPVPPGSPRSSPRAMALLQLSFSPQQNKRNVKSKHSQGRFSVTFKPP